VETVGLIAAPLTVITALMFWIGWMRTVEIFEHFGIHVRLVDLSNQDYVQRSVDGLFIPLVALLALGIVGNWTNAVIRDRVVRRRRRRVVFIMAVSLLVVGIPALLLGVLGLAVPLMLSGWALLFSPLLLGAGVLTVIYSRWLWRCRRGMQSARFVLVPWSRVELTLVSLLLVLCAFWAATEYARAVGRGEGARFAAQVAQNPGVIVYSEQRLYLDGPNVNEEILPEQPPSKFRYKYSGLRLFAESKDRLFLLPSVWTADTRTFMVTNGPEIRVDFIPVSRG
jgi:hypothetical protein